MNLHNVAYDIELMGGVITSSIMNLKELIFAEGAWTQVIAACCYIFFFYYLFQWGHDYLII